MKVAALFTDESVFIVVKCLDGCGGIVDAVVGSGTQSDMKHALR